ncbi:hypothetical protein ALP44_200009 [Pseudomonas syringae pv. theae]|uniref:Uncharacterized protein n=1 Tax=Pseudomonas syringae pv. theae TaxID=103985 RepID=A0A3M5M802_PSESX|nr:hypothetical protein ALP44_200009 [Pseudomonas syringae pv. theae]
MAKGLHVLEAVGYFRPDACPVTLDPSTGEQEFTRVKDDRPLPWRQPTGSRDGLGKTRFGGFFIGRENALVGSSYSRSVFRLRRFSRCFSRSLRRRIS